MAVTYRPKGTYLLTSFWPGPHNFLVAFHLNSRARRMTLAAIQKKKDCELLQRIINDFKVSL